mmetsp:Transcript_7357/g.11685  ORF Transcript_7357/g.11685 Transcript_7357/m.11685 type:complete len:397 (-) Transcript_7357:238-1428(-)|eukprot:CAMPEP_0184674952 /NCGR_PEP_ID=MMETSP0308-20130426/87527_1 /TAXON_ID=38269 /ORGANISM="Gloeochaete witrockiana, Strain SAG 46.84" /LENGTH=396 /DNA_ID=CAMNT_0027122617 /DNA_START=216 /DNA_END=1406 /DNA_ORIENTATION=-
MSRSQTYALDTTTNSNSIGQLSVQVLGARDLWKPKFSASPEAYVQLSFPSGEKFRTISIKNIASKDDVSWFETFVIDIPPEGKRIFQGDVVIDSWQGENLGGRCVVDFNRMIVEGRNNSDKWFQLWRPNRSSADNLKASGSLHLVLRYTKNEALARTSSVPDFDAPAAVIALPEPKKEDVHVAENQESTKDLNNTTGSFADGFTPGAEFAGTMHGQQRLEPLAPSLTPKLPLLIPDDPIPVPKSSSRSMLPSLMSQTSGLKSSKMPRLPILSPELTGFNEAVLKLPPLRPNPFSKYSLFPTAASQSERQAGAVSPTPSAEGALTSKTAPIESTPTGDDSLDSLATPLSSSSAALSLSTRSTGPGDDFRTSLPSLLSPVGGPPLRPSPRMLPALAVH